MIKKKRCDVCNYKVPGGELAKIEGLLLCLECGSDPEQVDKAKEMFTAELKIRSIMPSWIANLVIGRRPR